MRKWTISMLAVTLVASIGLSGCGNGNKEGASSPAAKPSQSADSPAPSASNAEPVKLSITWWGSQTRHDYTQKLLDLYTQLNPHITFEATPSGWDGYFDKLSAQAAGGAMPDIIQMDYGYISTFSKNDLLADLQPFVDNKTLNADDIAPDLLASGKVGGKLTGLAISSTAPVIAYNPDVFKSAGLDVPTNDWTWDEFMADMKQIQEKTGKYGYGANALTATGMFNLAYWFRQHGQSLYAPDGTKLGFIDGKLLTDYLQMQKTLVDEKAMPNPDQWAQISSKGKEAQPVVTGDGGVTYEWANFAVIVSGTNPNIKLVTPPQTADKTKALWIKPGMFFSVAKSSKHQEEAAKFIDWFTNSKEANDIIQAERGIPVSSKIRGDMKPSLTPQQQDMFSYIDTAINYSSQIDAPEPPGSAEVGKLFEDLSTQMVYGKGTPEQVAQDFMKKANEILARNASK